jgi:superoxide dismutase
VRGDHDQGVAYVKAFWNVVNWADVQDRFAAATTETPA